MFRQNQQKNRGSYQRAPSCC